MIACVVQVLVVLSGPKSIYTVTLLGRVLYRDKNMSLNLKLNVRLLSWDKVRLRLRGDILPNHTIKSHGYHKDQLCM